MQRFLQMMAIALAVIGLALWFFGGMHVASPSGPATGNLETDNARAAATQDQPMADFRPGVGFLAITWVVAAGLWLVGSRCSSAHPASN